LLQRRQQVRIARNTTEPGTASGPAGDEARLSAAIRKFEAPGQEWLLDQSPLLSPEEIAQKKERLHKEATALVVRSDARIGLKQADARSQPCCPFVAPGLFGSEPGELFRGWKDQGLRGFLESRRRGFKPWRPLDRRLNHEELDHGQAHRRFLRGSVPSGRNPIAQEAVGVLIVLTVFACSFRLCWLIATYGE